MTLKSRLGNWYSSLVLKTKVRSKPAKDNPAEFWFLSGAHAIDLQQVTTRLTLCKGSNQLAR